MWRHNRHFRVTGQKNFKYILLGYTNMASNILVVLIPRDWVKTLYIDMRGLIEFKCLKRKQDYL